VYSILYDSIFTTTLFTINNSILTTTIFTTTIYFCFLLLPGSDGCPSAHDIFSLVNSNKVISSAPPCPPPQAAWQFSICKYIGGSNLEMFERNLAIQVNGRK
jgi:hypothetical protein